MGIQHAQPQVERDVPARNPHGPHSLPLTFHRKTQEHPIPHTHIASANETDRDPSRRGTSLSDLPELPPVNHHTSIVWLPAFSLD